MKKLLVLLLILVPGVVAARDNSDAFITGFANGFNQAYYGRRPYQAPAQANQQSEVYQQAGVTYHYDAAINASNTRGNYYFFSYQECNRFLNGGGRGVFDECVRVPG